MKFKVYHATQPQFLPSSPPLDWPEDYELVAEVDATTPDTAFARTNSNGRHWSLQPGVTCFDPEARSTSIGDVVASSDGKVYRCESVGWREIT